MNWMMNDAIRGSRETVEIKAANFTDWLADTQVRIIGCQYVAKSCAVHLHPMLAMGSWKGHGADKVRA